MSSRNQASTGDSVVDSQYVEALDRFLSELQDLAAQSSSAEFYSYLVNRLVELSEAECARIWMMGPDSIWVPIHQSTQDSSFSMPNQVVSLVRDADHLVWNQPTLIDWDSDTFLSHPFKVFPDLGYLAVPVGHATTN